MRRSATGGAAWSCLLAAPVLLLATAPAAAEGWVGVRAADHRGHGRVVFEWPGAPAYELERQGDRAILRFGSPVALDLSGVGRPPRNVLGVAATGEGVEIALRPGARLRHLVVGSRLLVDVLDPAQPGASGQRATAPPQRGAMSAGLAAGTTPHAPTRDEPSGPPASAATFPPSTVPPGAAASARPASDAAVPPAAAPSSGASGSAATPASFAPRTEGQPRPVGGVPAPLPSPAPQHPVPAAGAATPHTAALAARLIATGGGKRAVLLPAGQDVGLAIFRRGDVVLAVLDAAQALDLSALRTDPLYVGMEARALPGGGTQLALRLAASETLRARRLDGAWVLEAVQPASTLMAASRAILPEMTPDAHDQIALRAAQPGRIVALADPETGLPLLVGTLREPGQAVAQLRRMPQADLLATELGAAALARADHVALRSVPDGFVLAAAGGARLALDPALAAPADDGAALGPTMTRLFQIASLPAATLADRLRAEQASVAAAPPLARAGLRRAAAETLLALGLPQEAQATLALGMAEDPRAAADPVAAALLGAAALLSGRLAEAAVLDEAPLPERDEVLLWRALLAAGRGEPRAAAPGLAATLPLALAYPEGLRARLLPRIADALTDAGAWDALRRLLDAAGERPNLAVARAALAEADGRTEEALAAYEAIAQGPDRLARARAIPRAVELRLSTGRVDARQAAQALAPALLAWRGDGRELVARRRLAELQVQAGDPRGAIGLLRETEALFPDEAMALRPAMQSAFLGALRQEGPLGAVALFDAHPDLLPTDGSGEQATVLLSEQLVALDLPGRAADLLRDASGRASGPGGARLGLRLAGLKLSEGDAAGALAALDQTATMPSDGLPEPLARDRTILAAKAEARLGRLPKAVAALQALGTAGAEPLADILAEARDWAGATGAMALHLRSSLPPAPQALSEGHRRSILRQAALLALAGDSASLASLRQEFAARFAGGDLAEPFAALTADPLRGLADLPRLQRELQLFRSLPARLEPLRAASLLTR